MQCGVWNQMKIWSSHLLDNLSNCLMNLKNSGDSTGFEPDHIFIVIIFSNLSQKWKIDVSLVLKRFKLGIAFLSVVCIGNEEFPWAMTHQFGFFSFLFLSFKFYWWPACVADIRHHWYMKWYMKYFIYWTVEVKSTKPDDPRRYEGSLCNCM